MKNEMPDTVVTQMQALMKDMLSTIKKLEHEVYTTRKDASEVIAAIVMEVGGKVSVGADTAAKVYGMTLTQSRDLLTDRIVFEVVPENPENANRRDTNPKSVG